MLPFSRNTTYTPGSPIKSEDLDDIQDCIIGGSHGDGWFQTPAIQGAPETDFAANIRFTPGHVTVVDSGAIAVWTVPLVLRRGDRLKEVVVTADRGGAGFVYCNLYRIAPPAAPTQLAGATVSTGTDWTDIVVAAGLTEVVAAGTSYYVRLAVTHTENKVAHVAYRIDHPLT